MSPDCIATLASVPKFSISFLTLFSSSTVLDVKPILAPSLAQRRAICFPIPRPEPVIIIFFPFKIIIYHLLQ